MSTVIAERELELDGEATGFVRFYAAERNLGGQGWTCEFHLVWPGFEQREKAGGVDSYQAVLEAFRGAPLYISRTDDYKSGRLSCMGAVLSAAPTRPFHPEDSTHLREMFDAKWVPETSNDHE